MEKISYKIEVKNKRKFFNESKNIIEIISSNFPFETRLEAIRMLNKYLDEFYLNPLKFDENDISDNTLDADANCIIQIELKMILSENREILLFRLGEDNIPELAKNSLIEYGILRSNTYYDIHYINESDDNYEDVPDDYKLVPLYYKGECYMVIEDLFFFGDSFKYFKKNAIFKKENVKNKKRKSA